MDVQRVGAEFHEVGAADGGDFDDFGTASEGL